MGINNPNSDLDSEPCGMAIEWAAVSGYLVA